MNLGNPKPGKKRDPNAPKRPLQWVLYCHKDTRYRASLISALYGMTLGEVIDRAVTCYGNALKIHETMEMRFPKQGLEVPEPAKTRWNRPNLWEFPQHRSFMEGRGPGAAPKTTTEEEEEPS